uniref:PWWP domain-containing protein n=1 Tax=Chrysocystis fragilis TaxID=1411660 RepID=A0A7S0TEY5_9STRA
MRSFLAGRQREKLLRLASLEDKKGEEEDAVLDGDRVERVVGFIESVEADPTVAMALVNVMKAYFMRGEVGQVGKLGLELLESEAKRREFAEVLGFGSVDELRSASSSSRKKAEAKKRPSLKRPREEEAVWRVAGDERLGSYAATEGSVARVEAWTRRQGRKHFRCTLLLGPRRGHLIELSDTALEATGHSARLDEALAKVPNYEALDGASAAPVADAARRLSLGSRIDEAWAKAFGTLVWAQDKPHEPPWPSIVVDPRTVADDKLLARAELALGKKHVLRFLGLPEASSLGFLPPSSLTPFTTATPPDLDAKLSKLRKKSRLAFDAALREAKILAKPPPPEGATIIVTYLGDDTKYRCVVLKDPRTAELQVRSPDFGPDEPGTIPFDPVEDDWVYP